MDHELEAADALKLQEQQQEPSVEEDPKLLRERACRTSGSPGSTWGLVNAATAASQQTKVPLGATANKLSSPVMEYYQKYAQNKNLNQYFSVSDSTAKPLRDAQYYCSIYELTPRYIAGSQSYSEADYGLNSYLPKERKRWTRPALIGQSSSVNGTTDYIKSMTEPQSTQGLPESQQQQHDEAAEHSSQENVDTSTEGLVITEEKSTTTTPQTSPLPTIERKTTVSPTSSVASQKPRLEWDSGADVGYRYQERSNGGVSTIERMAVKALRLDPEGTTERQMLVNGSSKDKIAIGCKPDANSTPLLGNVSGSESEIEITPIVKSHVPGIIAGDKVSSEEVDGAKSRSDLLKETKDACIETPKSANVFKLPHALSYSSSDESKSKSKITVPTIVGSSKERSRSDKSDSSSSPLKKSSSMNLLAAVSPTRLPLKRSQSELNLWGNEKALPRLIFNSTSSIATVVNNIKPPTCNKLIQTSMRICAQESVGVQVSVLKEERPPLPKRATSLAPRSLNSILKSSKNTYKVQNPKCSPSINDKSTSREEEHDEKEIESSSDQSTQNASLTPCADDTENITGRANSFEYFPGHIYENVPNGSSSHVSSVDTGRSNSTMPNTSSSLDEKLFGEPDSLVRDLEQSVKILKNLVDANKLDKETRQRLFHHVAKRIRKAKYADDQIDRNLEENVPWNPADARTKVFGQRTEIIQTLAKNTTDSSDDWKPPQKKKSPKKSAPTKESRAMKEMISMPAEIESSNSDKFDRNTDRTVMDGRKARMGLRADDCDRRSSSNTPTNKSESSECFLPQRQFAKTDKMKDMFITSTSNSSPQDQNRALLDAVVNSRRSPADSSNEAGNSADWRMPTTMSERRYEMRRCSNSDSGDTKLVSYAEMEKRNQLIWITNEISHLSNLKKLLEQPKSKPDRSCKSSPKKTKQSSSKHQQQQQKSHHRLRNGDLDDVRLNRQWSSHCNLATCPSPCTNSIKRLKKRNSSTQTATETSAAYSRTGSEIVSARIQSPNEKISHVCVQTSRAPPALPSPSSQMCSNCPVHRPVAPVTACTCTEQACAFCRSENRLHRRRFSSDEDKDEAGARFVCNDSEDAKAAKNHLNTNKMKCTCEMNDKASKNLKADRPKKLATASQTCEECHCEDSMCSCLRYKIIQPTCQCSRECQCANKLVCGFEKLQVRDNPPSRKKLFEKPNAASCTCECKKAEQVPNARSECNHHSSKRNPYDMLNSNKSPRSRDCCWVHQAEDQNKMFNGTKPKHAANSSTNDCKCCRLCGTTYQTNRKCNCAPEVYPKAVAYELSFANDNKNIGCNEPAKRSVGVEVKNIEKNVAIVSSSRSQEQMKRGGCTCGGMQRPFQRCDCNCRNKQSQTCDDKKNTLQEYLVSNHPRFADNVESRRQYVSEIQRLRQLRKDRRVQLLAMATTPNIFSPPRQPKVIKNVQMKISDQEMKARLRTRYFQLSEVRAKRKQQQLQEQARCNKLMAKIFCKKLQQKVLKGQVDLSQSVSVISNL